MTTSAASTIRNTNDGSTLLPRLRFDLCEGTLADLPDFTTFPRGDERTRFEAIRAAGFEGVQTGDIARSTKYGLRATASGRVDHVGSIDTDARAWKDAGFDAATLHVGTGFEAEGQVDRLVEAVLKASSRHNFPLYIETHRATITNDPWQTVRLVERFPEIRFNGDFSHWYTGSEMVYGDFDAKLQIISPVLERVRFIHGRIGTPGCIQVDIGDGTNQPFVEHFKKIWTRCFTGFLASAVAGDFVCFAPELLPPRIYYARQFKSADGTLAEEGDRWQQATLYCRIAEECFAAAQKSLEGRD